jgi:hypothetical protein
LSSINEQNAAANYNNSLARAASSTAKSNSSSKILNPIQDKNIVKPTSTVSGPGSWKINPTTQKYEWVPLSTTVKQIANPLTNL